MTCIAKLILHCIILSTFLPKSDLDYRPIIPLQITHQITKVLINNKNHSSAINDTKITEPKIFGLREFNDLEDKNSKVGKSKPTTADGYVKEAATLIAAGKKEEALNAYKAALKMKPNFYKIRIEMGDLLKSLGRLEEAEKNYLKVLKSKQDYGTAWFKLGNLYYAQGKIQLAVDNLTKAVNLDSTLLDALLILGQILKSANHLEDAITCFQQSLKLSPNQPVAQFNLAWIYMDQGHLDLAITTLQQPSKDIQLQPQYYDVYSNLCTAFHIRGQTQVAAKCFMKIVDQNPNHAVSLGNLGILKQMDESYEEASAFFKKALQVSPELVDFNYNLAICYQQLRKYHDALRHYKETIRLSPSYPLAENIGELVVDMGDKFLIMKDHDSAAKCYSFAIEISPTATMTHYKLGITLQRSYKITEAIQSFQNALNQDPNVEDAYYKLEHCLNTICDWTNYDTRMKKLAEVVSQDIEHNQRANKIPVLFSLGYPLTHEQRTGIAKSYANATLEKVHDLKNKRKYKHPTKLTRDGRLRIGFVSSDFGHHPVGHLIQSLPGVFDRKRFEIFCYSLSPDDNSIFRAKIVQEAEHFVDLSKVENDGDAADLIHADGIHILVNMNGYTTGARDGIFALKPAPIQTIWLGYPATSGASFMEYIIADPVSAPLALASQFTEKVAHMPNSYFLGSHQHMFAHLKNKVVLSTESTPLDDVRDNAALINCNCDLSPIFENIKIVTELHTIARLPTMNSIETMVRSGQLKCKINNIEVRNGAFFPSLENGIPPEAEAPKDLVVTTRQQYGLPDDAIVYSNFQQLYKLNPTILQVWVNILKRVPKSVLWLPKYPPGAVNNLRAYSESLGLEKGRIIFCNPTPSKEEYARRMQLADVALDSNLFSSQTTGMDILWAGLPIVSLPGETFVSRVGASQLAALGCPELIASNLREYENIAVKLGTDRDYLKKIRAKVWIGRTESTLFNIRLYAKDMGHLFLRMWKKHEAGENPDHITVTA